jgi:hypothetical protein
MCLKYIHEMVNNNNIYGNIAIVTYSILTEIHKYFRHILTIPCHKETDNIHTIHCTKKIYSYIMYTT